MEARPLEFRDFALGIFAAYVCACALMIALGSFVIDDSFSAGLFLGGLVAIFAIPLIALIAVPGSMYIERRLNGAGDAPVGRLAYWYLVLGALAGVPLSFLSWHVMSVSIVSSLVGRFVAAVSARKG
ncbi:hypothetical protein [Jiangella endophytica]|uniref:hypothetical protein n=1 Tax=Jiangella endophytica TaxID=1623398 RepID=UPI0013002EE4|nr:hypothetical protein [Jiangella endophytica]